MTTNASALEMWAEKQMREVEEGVRPARRIVLTTDGVTWERWEPVIGLDPKEWTKSVEMLLDVIAEELPKRRVQLTFTAEDVTGATLSTHIRSVTGRNQAAADLGTQAGAKALADGIASVAKTCDAVLQTARQMMEFQSTQLDKTYAELTKREEDLRKAHELLAMIQKLEIEEGTAGNPVAQALAKHVDDAMPVAMQALELFLEKRKAAVAAKPATVVAKSPKTVVQSTPAAEAAPTNGAST